MYLCCIVIIICSIRIIIIIDIIIHYIAKLCIEKSDGSIHPDWTASIIVTLHKYEISSNYTLNCFWNEIYFICNCKVGLG